MITSTFQSLELLVDTITGCWDQEGDARLTSSCVLNRLKQMGGSNKGVVTVPPLQKPLSHALTSSLEHYSVEIVDDNYHENQQEQLLQHQRQSKQLQLQQPQQQQHHCQGLKTIVDDDFHVQQQQQLQQQQQTLQQQQEPYQDLNQGVKAPLITNAENT